MNRPFFSLSKKALLAVAVILLPIFLTFLHGYDENKRLLEKHILDDLDLNSDAIEGQVFQFLEKLKGQTRELANDTYMKEEFDNAARGDKESAVRLGLYLKDKLPLHENSRSIYLIAVNGKVVSSTDPASIGKDVSGSPFFTNASSGAPFTEVRFKDTGEPGVAVSEFLREGKDKKIIGIVTRFFGLSEINGILRGEYNFGAGERYSARASLNTFETYLVNSDGFMITGSRFIKDSVLRQKVDTRAVRSCLESKRPYLGFYGDYRGVEVAGSSRCIKGLGWTLLAEVDGSEALKAVSGMKKGALIGILVMAGIVVILFALFYRYIIFQLKGLSNAAAKISAGCYDVNLSVRTNDEIGALSAAFNTMASEIEARNRAIRRSEIRYSTMLQSANDAIVTTDGDEKITGFNSSAERLFGYASAEVLGKNVEILMPERYRERHREAIRNVKTNRYSAASGKTREFYALRKDGTEFPVSITMSPAEVEGKLTFLAIMRDMTESKKAEEALKEKEAMLNKAQSIAHLGSWDWDIVGNTLLWSDEIYRIFGLEPREFKGTYEAFLNSVHPEDRQLVIDAVNAALYERRPYSIDHRVVLPDGSVRAVHEQADVTYGEKGRALRMVGTVQDITERRKAEEDIKSVAKFPLENPNPVMRLSLGGVVLYTNPAGMPLLGVLGAALGGKVLARWVNVIKDAWRKKKNSEFELSEGGRIYSVIFTPVMDSGYINIYGRDITDRKAAEFELKKLSMAIEQSVNIVFITDVDGNIEYVNPVFEEVTGYSKEEAIGQTPKILASGETPNERYEDLWKTILSGKTWRSLVKNKKKSGGYYWCNAIISPIKNEAGKITHFLAVQEDITEKMASEERIKYLANHDELTGLVNRARFIDLIEEWIHCTSGRGDAGVLCFIDMDQFKLLNDTYGHGAGDEFLRRIGLLLKNSAQSSYRRRFGNGDKDPIVSRLSGDEFAVFLPSADAKAGLDIIEELRTEVESFRFAEHDTSATVSIGAVLYPEHGKNSKDLFTRADAAMYRAKELGRNRYHLYRPEDQDLEKMHSRLSWKEKILKALKEDRFVPWFQPILDLSSETVSHYEVLARMRDEEGKVLLPGAFIDIAERFGLVGQIDRTIISKAMSVQALMNRQGKSLSFGINLSGKDLCDEDLLAFIRSRINETGADPGGLVFEITETSAIADLGRAIRFIKELKALGCRFALDDFGVGFTSFTYLKEMQVDFIKIDGSFIRKLHENPNDQIFVKAITDVARGLKIRSIAEFVETEETLEILKRFKVDFAQGYLIGKPGPLLGQNAAHALKEEPPAIRLSDKG